eukprot:GHVU01138232.1.p1 GENE.GHVU01138232.1~~GHVU01138232.1.p1  ORF type:complete len:190 (+),score=1.95 GHVU01138232.1:185-754(+)
MTGLLPSVKKPGKWTLPEINATSSNGVYLNTLGFIHGEEIGFTRRAFRRYKESCGPEATGGAANTAQGRPSFTCANMEFAVEKACRDLERIWEHGSQTLGTGERAEVLKDVAEKLSSDSKKVYAKYLRERIPNGIEYPQPRTSLKPGFEESKTDEGWACPSADLAANVASLHSLCRGNLRVEYRIERPC